MLFLIKMTSTTQNHQNNELKVAKLDNFCSVLSLSQHVSYRLSVCRCSYRRLPSIFNALCLEASTRHVFHSRHVPLRNAQKFPMVRRARVIKSNQTLTTPSKKLEASLESQGTQRWHSDSCWTEAKTLLYLN